ncbi:hypothetical protein FSP39_004009 [Pinctada imbricata]|uniref:Basement membrane-specific heparan sulfate proteoglycan core protein n=1 Tax=Pinctada imbricata TaxID=66713 RepID=A0AA88YP01_PINIB|nr:hypothetical protein FSP39_004009 [Pinctada imbricata]
MSEFQVAITALPCGHTFHGTCIEKWLHSNNSCPSCRNRVERSKVVWRLFFDCDADHEENTDCGRLNNKIRELQVSLSEKEKAASDVQKDNDSLLKKLKGVEKEKKQLDNSLRSERTEIESLKKQLQYYQYSQNSLDKEKEECRKIKRKFIEYQNIEKLLTGCEKDMQNMLANHRDGHERDVESLVKYVSMLKREYEKVKVEKKAIKGEFDKYKRENFSKDTDLKECKTQMKLLNTQLVRSEEDLKTAEREKELLKKRVLNLQSAIKSPRGLSSAASIENLCRTPMLNSEKDFEFDDVSVIVNKRSVDSLVDDEDVLLNDEGGSGEGSGVDPGLVLPTAEYPEYFRVTINFTDLVYSDSLGNRNSKEFNDLAEQVSAAIRLLFAKTPGQQDVVIVQFGPGSVMVTFDLGTEGFYNRSVLYEVLNKALIQGVISPYRVSPVGFEFKPLQDGMTCPDTVGRELSRLPRGGDNRANLLINNMFPCRGYVIAWHYYRIVPRYTGYVGVWRQVDDYKFILVGKTELPVDREGNLTVFANPPILVEKGDFIGIFYPRDAEEGVIASAIDTTPGILPRELYENYYSRFYNEDVRQGETFDLETVQFEEAKMTFALKAVMDYTTVDDRVRPACPDDKFRCNDGSCIEKIFRCDGQDDCYDASDEQNCPAVTCVGDEFRCADNRQCIPRAFVCNQQPDCVDGSDERNCTSTCRSDQFRCDDGQCIDDNLACDGFPDCNDRSDEAAETCRVGPAPCPEGGFRCDDGACVAANAGCNRVQDCKDGSDEDPVRCGFPTTPAPCQANEWRCDNGQCIPDDLKCDAYPDCDDKSDESVTNCRTAPALCPEGLYRCEDNSCVTGAECDGQVDCADSSDESSTKCGFQVTLSIQNNQLVLNEGETAVFDCSATGNVAVNINWRRGTGRLPDKVQVQNGRLVIPDITVADVDDYICYTETIPGVQEVKGDLIVIPACPDNQFRCTDGSCIQTAFYCDGFPDCADRSDEVNCTSTSGCPEGQYTCDDGTCARADARCNGRADCGDGSDEFPSKCGCGRVGQFMCANGRLCVEGFQECDGQYQCPDRSDEHANCTYTCAPDQFTCDNGACISAARRCDGFPDCTDLSDEKQEICARRCRAGEFQCRDRFQCIDQRMVCDGVPDCADGTDETVNCPSCRSDQFECRSGQCIDTRRRCDGQQDCFDGSDELECPCRDDQFTCGDGRCLPASVRCNGRQECEDNSDEDPAICGCRDDQFTCGNGQCIDARRRCDRRQDCQDNSDEQGCPCRSGEFTCGDGTCLPAAVRCNGRRECEDNSDEDPAICGCRDDQFTCGNRQCIDARRRCDRRQDCQDNSDESGCPCRSDEFTCGDGTCLPASVKCNGRRECEDNSDEDPSICVRPVVVSAVPPALTLREGREARFQCSASQRGAQIQWTRRGGRLPVQSSVENNVLTIPEVKLEDAGDYVCDTVNLASTGAATVSLRVQSVGPVTPRPTLPSGPCNAGEAVCNDGVQCIPADYRCDGDIDCRDGSDENCPSVGVCEPNEMKCNNGRCVMKFWRCDGDNDCGDGSDELNCGTRKPTDPCNPDEFQCTTINQCVPASYHCDNEIDCQDRSDEIGCAPPIVNIAPPPNIEVEIGGVFTIICEAVGTPTPLIVWRLNWGNIPTGDRVHVSSINGRGNLTIEDARLSDSGAYTCEAINVRGSIFASPDAIIIVRRLPNGICEPPFFNVEASVTSECVRCFCFGHTDQCYSSDLQISRINLIGEMKMINFDTKVSIDTRYVERLPSGEYSGFYQVGDGLRLIPQGIYYWSLPREFLGDRLTSYGGDLKYDIYYAVGRGVSQAVDQPDIIISGNGVTLYHRTTTILRPDGRVTVTAPLVPSAWTKSDGPKRGDTPVVQLATREELMMVLENLEYIYIRSQYDRDQALTRIGNIVFTTGVREETGLGRAVFVENCQCPPGYSGLSCQDCAPGYRRVQQGSYLGICTRCNCNGHSSDCDPVTSECRFCQHNTEGPQCQRCRAGYYGDATQGTANACKPCPCPLTSPPNQFSPTCILDRDGQPTCTACPQGYEGRRCERCAVGYKGDPTKPGDYCTQLGDYCDSRGSLDQRPDPLTQQCTCKLNVQGRTCDECKPNTFYLDINNPYGCIKCFCMGVTNRCLSTSWNRAQISSSFTRDRQEFTLTDTLGRQSVTSGFTINSNLRELIYRNFNNLEDAVYYWNLPSKFLGDKVMSYGGSLRFVLLYRPGRDSSSQTLDAPLVEIKGNSITLMHRARQTPAANTPVPNNVKFYESEWVRMNGQPATRELLLMALADLDSIKIRATFTKDTDQASIRDVIMDIAEDRVTGRDRAYAVEQCQCPRGYKGLSCEDCDIGYKRTQGGLYLGFCERCECNGHSSECDPETGVCRNCQHNTEGDRCERCSAGYYGNATGGTPSDCQPCPCPLPQAPNQFSPTCILDTDGQVTCTACPAGHTGRRCESCIQGYTGNPLQPGDYCKIDTGPDCQCDARGTVPNTQCDPVSRQCQCKAHARGLRCSSCAAGYFNLASDNSQGCLECYCSGVTDQCSSSSYYRDRVYPNLSGSDTHNFVLTNRRLTNVISDGFTVDTDRRAITFNAFSAVQRERESLFFSLPPKFRGNQVTSYGGQLTFTIETNVALDAGQTFRDVDFEIVTSGQRQRMYYLFNPPLRPFESRTYTIKLVESSFRSLDGSEPTRNTFMAVLSDIEAILIRATYHSIMGSATLRDLHMDTAVAGPTGYGRALDVESCRCPPGYTGLSCEQCAAGFVRQDSGARQGECVRCNCNGHASSCDTTTGECLNCQHNTVGDRCERCADGFYGDATSGTPNDCRPCPCPLTLPSNRFSTTCHLDNDGQVTCDRCPPGYLGRDCGTCDTANGYTGNPREVGGKCTRDTVILRPRITVNPVRVEESVGQTIVIQCNVRGPGPFNVVWSRENGQQLSSRSQVSPSYTLTIRNLMKSDEGRYVCTATNIHGSTRETVSVIVIGDKQPIRVRIEEPKDATVDEGTSVRFVCVATGSLTQMTYILSWTRQGGRLPSKAIDNNGVLVIPNAQAEDQGTYICTGSDMMSTDTAVATLTVSRSETAPIVRIEPRYQTVKEGELVEFRCIANGRPTPVVEWRRSSGRINPQATISNGVLRIPFALRSDEAQYFCKATNVAGTNEVRTILYVTEGDIRPDVTVIIRQTSVIAVIGSTTQLVCYVDDDSLRATLVWSRVGGLPTGSSQDNGVLTLNNIQPSYAGRYVCTAITSDGDRGTGTATVTVQQNTITSRPTVKITPDRITIPQGTTGSIRCEVTGEPQPTIRWTKSRADLSPRHQVNGATLRITNTQMEDRGIYICRAENSVGISQGWVVVEVERRELPKVDLYPEGTQTISVGGSALFQCRVMGGDPPPTVVWTRAGGEALVRETTEIMDNGVLMFKSVTGQEAGAYVCTVSNDLGSVTATATLVIQGPPRIVITPRTTVYALVGQRVEVECVGEGDPIPTVYWRYDQGPQRGDLPSTDVQSFDRRQGSSTLTIESVTTSDTGNYVCVAENTAGTTEENVQIIVQDDRQPVKGVTITGPETISAVEGQSITLECETEGLVNPIVRWRRREGALPPNHRIQGGTLYIPRFTRQYAGEYICSATTAQQNYETSVFIIVTVTPTLTISPARVEARAGETVSLRCQPQGQPPFNIEWTRADGRPLSPSARQTNDGLLQILAVTAADAGRYRCVATNAAGPSDGIAIVEVQVPPTVIASERSKRPTTGELVELRCDARGSPSPTVTWEKEGGALPSNSDIRNGILTIYNVRSQDSGRFICTAQSNAGTARDYIVLSVQEINGGGPVRINTQTVNVGERVEMECVVSGTPKPTVKWSRLDGPLPVSSTVNDVYLVIPQVRLEDAGTYVCTAENVVGIDEQRVNLFVRARPIITGGSESLTAALGSSASLVCDAQGYPQPEITWYKRNGQMPREYSVDDGTLNVFRVRPEDAGEYLCKAQNDIGQSEQSRELVVGDLVPYFKQDPVSYISYPSLKDVYLNFDILLSLRPETNDGLVLYNGQYDNANGDYVCFGMRQGYPEFHFDVGSGPAVIRGNQTLDLNQWHTVKLKRDRTQGSMEVNDKAVYSGKSQGRFEGLDLQQNMYLGGVPDYQRIPAPARFSSGFVGSVSQVQVKGVDVNLGSEYIDMQGVEPYNACLERPCMNRGQCQAANTPYGYRCVCTQGFTGQQCEAAGQGCYPGVCGPTGRCHDVANGYQCICPMGRIGPGCQNVLQIVNPQFNVTSFASYPTIRGARFIMRIELEFKPQSLDDGIVMYSGQSDDGSGDYFVIMLQDGHLNFRYNTGSGPATLKSRQKLRVDEWVKVTVSKSGQDW